LHTPVHDEVLPAQYDNTGGTRPPAEQSVSVAQHPVMGTHASRHAPEYDTLTPEDCAMQRFEYVMPSQPHTGASSRVHAVGSAAHTPTLVHAPGERSQN